MAESTGLRTYAFVLAVPDLRCTVGYFEKALGFGRDWGMARTGRRFHAAASG